MNAIAPGFDAPVFDAQAVFRAVMDAMARPGRAMALPENLPSGPVSPSFASLVLTLCDNTTALWLDPALAADDAFGRWVSFHTGAPRAAAANEAAFALVSDPRAIPPLGDFAQGTNTYPDRSTTLLVAVQAIGNGPLTLRGPGIWGEETFGVVPSAALPVEEWRANGKRFPRGVDLVFAAPGAISALPRSTRIGHV